MSPGNRVWLGVVLIAVSGCTPFPPALACIDVTRADCVTAQEVASELLGMDLEAAGVVVRRYRPNFELIGRRNPDFSAHVYITRMRDGPATVVLVIREVADGVMTGQIVIP